MENPLSQNLLFLVMADISAIGPQRVKKILYLKKLHFLLYFSFKAQFEVCQNDPEEVFEEDIFAQTTAILKGHPLDQTLLNKRFII